MVPHKIFCFWTGRNDMSPTRKTCLDSMRNNFPYVELVDWKALPKYILKDHPLHPGYRYLSDIHRSDYLRCYFANFYGGGYADIKPYTSSNNWDLCFNIMDTFSEIEIVGQPEFLGGTPVSEYNNPYGVVDLVSVSYYICRANTKFSNSWYRRMIERMDHYLPELRQHPATSPFGGEQYPIPWTELLGNIFPHVLMERKQENARTICSALSSGIDRNRGWR